MFVTGCHRSGTSLVASLMHGLVCNAQLASRSGDLEVKLENPLGFFESQRLVDVNEALLRLIGRTWETPPLLSVCWNESPLLEAMQPLRSRLSTYSLEHCWVDKDPRLCITYSAFLHILLRRVPLVVALREPLNVATSLFARNGFSLNRGLIIWLLYNYHIASQLTDDDLLLPYERLLNLAGSERGSDLQSEVDAFLEIHRIRRTDNSLWDEVIKRCIRPDFNRSGQANIISSKIPLDQELLKVCSQRFNLLQKAFTNQQRLEIFVEQFSTLPRVAFDVIRSEEMLPEARQVNLNSQYLQLQSDFQGAQELIDDQNVIIKRQNDQLNALKSSCSWRFTAPVRFVLNQLRGL